jgi:hypothetical protein
MRPEQLIVDTFSEVDKATMRADLDLIAERMAELRDMGAWQKLLGHQARFEWAVMIERVAAYRNALD